MDIREQIDGKMRKCDICGRVFVPGNRPDGCPNGVSMVQRDGTMVTMCADCLIRIGKERRGE